MNALTPLIDSLRKLFAPFPHLPKGSLQAFVPFLSWYVLLRGLFKVIDGIRSISKAWDYSRMPKIFTTLLDVDPTWLVIGGLLSIAAGVLYFKAFTPLADGKTRWNGWQNWAVAALVLTLVGFYEALFLRHSLFLFLFSSVIGWYLIFEFELAIKTEKPVIKTQHRKSK